MAETSIADNCPFPHGAKPASARLFDRPSTNYPHVRKIKSLC